MRKRVVITAVGVISSLGDDSQAIADTIAQKRTNFRHAAHDPELTVCPIDGFDLREITGRHKNLRYLNRGAAMSVAAAMKAIQAAHLSEAAIASAGLFCGAGPNLDLGDECPHIENGTMDTQPLAALWILRFLPNTATSTISQLGGIHGENATLGNACAASLQAIGEAYRKVRDGYLAIAVAGGGDSRLGQGGLAAYRKAGALCRAEGRPQTASRPFDATRNGFVPGEGAAYVVLEAADDAHRRGAAPIAEILGYGASLDGYAMTAPCPDGRFAEQAVRGALAEGRLSSAQIDLVSAHGTGTHRNDAMEAALLERTFNRSAPAVVAIKSWIGHLASACGAVELAICLSALQSGLWPAIRNLNQPCNPALNYLRGAVATPPCTVLLQNFGFGGQNAALVIRSCRP